MKDARVRSMEAAKLRKFGNVPDVLKSMNELATDPNEGSANLKALLKAMYIPAIQSSGGQSTFTTLFRCSTMSTSLDEKATKTFELLHAPIVTS